MEKLQKYNQKLLAILGTMVIAGLGFIMLAGIYFFIDSIIRTGRNNNEDNSIRVEAKRDSTDQTRLREQSITFGFPHLIDTLKAFYVIPVSQVNLEDPEEIREKEFSSIRSKTYSTNGDYDDGYSNLYNNLILYDQLSGTKIPVFDLKIGITDYENLQVGKKNYLIVTGAVKDTNKDGKLNMKDLKTFYIYSVEDKLLKQVAFENMGMLRSSLLYNSKEIF